MSSHRIYYIDSYIHEKYSERWILVSATPDTRIATTSEVLQRPSTLRLGGSPA